MHKFIQVWGPGEEATRGWLASPTLDWASGLATVCIRATGCSSSLAFIHINVCTEAHTRKRTELLSS